MMEIPEMMRQASSMKTECEWQQKLEMMREQPIEEIVKEHLCHDQWRDGPSQR